MSAGQGWHRPALLIIFLLSAALSFLGLERQGYGNTYYAAAVESMLTGWHNFFFVSFDSGGFLAIDKPPVGLWVQVAAAKLFGFNGVSLFLPQAFAGLLSVALSYYLVRRAFGTAAGLLAALALAVTPISVVINRNNTMDSQLVLILMLAAWAATIAAERGRLRALLACGALVGLGYNIKMLQAYPVVPVFGLMYGLWAPIRLGARLVHLALTTAVLVLVSLSWSTIVDLTPSSERPYIGSSGTNSTLGLALGYNGLTRVSLVLASVLPALRVTDLNTGLTVAPAPPREIGPPGPLRLMNVGVAGQASWLLPLALIGLVVAICQTARFGKVSDLNPADAEYKRVSRRRIALTLWGLWLLVWGAYFSFARFFHLYYLVMLGPAVAALTGIGTLALWRCYRQAGRRAWLMPFGLVVTAAVQASIMAPFSDWSGWLLPLVTLPAVLAAALLAAPTASAWGMRASPVVAGVGTLALLAAPAIWSAVSLQEDSGGGWLVAAGPDLPGSAGQFPSPGGGQRAYFAFSGPGAQTFSGQEWNTLDPALVQYLLTNQGSTRFLVATPSSSYASLFILMTGQPAMALGGYQGWDEILSPTQFFQQVSIGSVRFVLLDANSGPAARATDQNADLAASVRSSCAIVPAGHWQSNPGDSAAQSGFARLGQDPVPGRSRSGQLQQQLYDCSAK